MSKRRFSNWFNLSTRPAKSTRRPGPRRSKQFRTMSLESLEDRKVMAASLAFTAPGELTITADAAGSRVYIYDLDPNDSPYYSTSYDNNYYQVITISNDGTRSNMFHKSQVASFKFIGSNYNDVYYAPTGIGYYGRNVVHTVEGRGGNDTITTGMYADTVYGGGGSDEIHGCGGNDTLNGGSERDMIWGDAGHDAIHGGSGYDDLYGGAGNDTIQGGSDPDWIEGGAGDDHLFGEGGNDFLYGGADVDGLYGGSGADYLHGGAGPDRFLILTNETGSRVQEFQDAGGVTRISIADTIADDGDEDIRVRFTNEGARTVTWPDGYSPGSTTYTAGTWSESNIKLIDEALATMAEKTRNNALLYNSQGGEPQMFRLGNASNNYVAFNDGVNTHYSNQAFQWNGSFNADWAVQVVFHEFGHSWDTTAEAERLIDYWGDRLVTEFRQASGWTQTRPTNIANFTQSEDDAWWYSNDADFVRWYAKTNPLEDYAETFSAYFMHVAGRTFVDGGGAEDAIWKSAIIETWVTQARNLGAAGRPVGAGGVYGDPNAVSGGAAPSVETSLLTAPVDLAVQHNEMEGRLDVNGTDSVNLLDLVAMARHLNDVYARKEAGGSNPAELYDAVMDVNSDGENTIADLLPLVHHLRQGFGLANSAPSSLPASFFDPDRDDELQEIFNVA